MRGALPNINLAPKTRCPGYGVHVTIHTDNEPL